MQFLVDFAAEFAWVFVVVSLAPIAEPVTNLAVDTAQVGTASHGPEPDELIELREGIYDLQEDACFKGK